MWDAFRRWGYLQADLDPLGDLQPVAMPELEVTGPEADAARRFYCGTIGVEFMHIADRERRQWNQRLRKAIANEFWNGWCARKFSSRSCKPAIWERSVIRSRVKRLCCHCWMESWA